VCEETEIGEKEAGEEKQRGLVRLKITRDGRVILSYV